MFTMSPTGSPPLVPPSPLHRSLTILLRRISSLLPSNELGCVVPNCRYTIGPAYFLCLRVSLCVKEGFCLLVSVSMCNCVCVCDREFACTLLCVSVSMFNVHLCVWYVCSRNVSVREDYKWKLWGHMCSHGHQQPIGMSLLTVETLKRVNALCQNYRQRHNMDPIVEWLFCLTLCFRVWSDTTPISSLLTLSYDCLWVCLSYQK